MELCGCDHFRQFFHIDRLDVENVWLGHQNLLSGYGQIALTETLVADVEVPEIDSQVVGRHVCFAVAIDADRVDMVGVRVCVHFPRHSRHDVVVERHARQAQVWRLRWVCR